MPSAQSHAESFIRSLTDDLDSITARLDKVAQGKVRYVDCFQAVMADIKKDIRLVREAVAFSIIPSEE